MSAAGSPIESYLQHVHDELVGLRSGRWPTTSRSSRRRPRAPSGSCLAPATATSTRVGDSRRRVHDPVDLQAVRLRAGARGPRARRRCCGHGRRRAAAASRSTRSASTRSPSRPDNPMINAGAIADDLARRGRRRGRSSGSRQCLLRASPAASSTLDEAVFASETRDRRPQPRDRATCCAAAGSLSSEARRRPLDAYFRQCSVARHRARPGGDGRDAGRRAAVNPVTGERVRAPGRRPQHVLSVMTTCGMYDAAGEWMLRVGLPAKSGVAGGHAGGLPGQFGHRGSSRPPLDARGNSVRGVAAFKRIAADLQLHFLHAGRPAGQTLGRAYSSPQPHRPVGAASRPVGPSTPQPIDRSSWRWSATWSSPVLRPSPGGWWRKRRRWSSSTWRASAASTPPP